jgi:hypothetical protein
MSAPHIVIITVLLMVAFPLPHVQAAEQHQDDICMQHMTNSREYLYLRDALRDEERSQILLWDRASIHDMLQKPELRQEMLQHPRFLRLMMQSREMRQELLGNEQMMREVLRNPEIHREVNRNREMVEEIENNETYRHMNQEHQSDILEELFLESTQ